MAARRLSKKYKNPKIPKLQKLQKNELWNLYILQNKSLNFGKLLDFSKIWKVFWHFWCIVYNESLF